MGGGREARALPAAPSTAVAIISRSGETAPTTSPARIRSSHSRRQQPAAASAASPRLERKEQVALAKGLGPYWKFLDATEKWSCADLARASSSCFCCEAGRAGYT